MKKKKKNEKKIPYKVIYWNNTSYKNTTDQ